MSDPPSDPDKGLEHYTTADKEDRWRVHYTLPGERRKSLSFEDKRMARRFRDMRNKHGAARALAWSEALQDATTAPVTVEEAWDRWLGTLTRPSEASKHLYRLQAGRSWLPRLGDLDVQTLTHDDVAAWVRARLQEGRATTTVRQELGRLHSMLEDCRRRDEVTVNAADGIRLPRKASKEPTVITREEFDRLVAAMSDKHRPLVHLLGATGLRWSEAIALRWDDVDLDALTPVLHVSQAWKRGHKGSGARHLGDPKTPASVRTVSLYADTVRMLRVHREATGMHPSGLVFPGRTRDGQHRGINPGSFMTDHWRPACVKAGLDPAKVTPHVLRHSHISWLLAAGAPTYLVTRRVGHETTAITEKVYGHWIPDAQRLTDVYVDLVMGERQATQDTPALEGPA